MLALNHLAVFRFQSLCRSMLERRFCSNTRDSPTEDLRFQFEERAFRDAQESQDSLSDARPFPSAMLLTADTAARRTWLVRPYISSRGKERVTWYTSSASSNAFCQALRSRNVPLIGIPTSSIEHSAFSI